MTYSVDTSALMDGWVRHYPKDVFPRIWESIDELISQEILIASSEVLKELEKQEDDLTAWALDRKHMFVPIDDDIQVSISEILRDYPRLVDTRRDRSSGDPWVIALARVRKCSVLTGERSTSKIEKPNIPDVCIALGIRCVNMLQLFRDQEWVFR
ncbi:MAG: DUF4411 family protein [Desulfomonile tiedjei]|nr:DUF4411 family protein [Desulfomonile tiedjei]